eukprot:TRINITY_DN11611_c0_g1_i2.p1 TRINITY_DN11611_c0_g1~~TRINITY_DN11611_c0_g1_i2.p1  ORF type:complete len:158 (-),score=15.60 TRINITY_DN11611_c0_g1_i2:160-633(-)
MGIHWGEPICKEDVVTGRMDYFGPVVNATSRIGNYPQGGRIALSECAFELIQDKLEELGSPYTREIGDKMFKGISTPIKLFEMIPESLVDRITYLEEFVSLTESFTQDQMEGRVEDKLSSDSVNKSAGCRHRKNTKIFSFIESNYLFLANGALGGRL